MAVWYHIGCFNFQVFISGMIQIFARKRQGMRQCRRQLLRFRGKSYMLGIIMLLEFVCKALLYGASFYCQYYDQTLVMFSIIWVNLFFSLISCESCHCNAHIAHSQNSKLSHFLPLLSGLPYLVAFYVSLRFTTIFANI